MANITAKRRFGWLFGAAGVLGVALTWGALEWIAKEGEALPIHVIIAVTLAVVLSLLLAAGLMGLIFMSSDGGHDQAAADESSRHEPEGWQDL
ncbi:hypothetical protein ACSMXM_15330 [Pacificimonas sp. ICDLI1SI03]